MLVAEPPVVAEREQQQQHVALDRVAALGVLARVARAVLGSARRVAALGAAWSDALVACAEGRFAFARVGAVGGCAGVWAPRDKEVGMSERGQRSPWRVEGGGRETYGFCRDGRRWGCILSRRAGSLRGRSGGLRESVGRRSPVWQLEAGSLTHVAVSIVGVFSGLRA